MDAIAIGTAGLTSAAQRFNASAAQIVNGSGDSVQPIVGLVQAKTDFQLSATVVKTADQMLGALLDIKV